MPSTITPKLGKRVWLHLTGPIKLFDFSNSALKDYVSGDYPATWMENRFRGRKSPVLFIDNSNVGIEAQLLNDLFSQGLVTVKE